MRARSSLHAIALFASLALATHTAHATNNPPAPDPGPAATSSAEAAADAAATARAAAAQQQRAEGGEATVYGDTSRYSSHALALGLSSMAAAPAVAGECLVHTRGAGVFGIGVTGGTRLDGSCMEDVRRDRTTAMCLQIADRYAAAQLLEAFVRQLEKCGGVHVDKLPTPPVAVVAPPPPPVAAAAPPPAPSVTPADLAASEKRVNDRMDRAFRQGIGK